MGLRKSPKEKLDLQRAALVGHLLPSNAKIYDSGVARAESVPGIPVPQPNGEIVFGGVIVVANDRFVYTDIKLSYVVVEYDDIVAVDTFRSSLPEATGLSVELDGGSTFLFSGSTPFIIKLYGTLKEVSAINSKYEKVLKDGLDQIFSRVDKLATPKDAKQNLNAQSKSPTTVSKPRTSAKESASPPSRSSYKYLIAEAAVEVKDCWLNYSDLIEAKPAWLILWDNSEIDLLVKGKYSNLQLALNNAKPSDFISIVESGKKRKVELWESGIISVVLAGQNEFHFTLAPKSKANLEAAQKLQRNS